MTLKNLGKAKDETRLQLETEVSNQKRQCWMCDREGDEGARDEEEVVQEETVGRGRSGWNRLGKGKLRVMQWNADGINTKRVELEEFVNRWEVDVVVVQESKLAKSHKTPKLQGFTAVRKDRI